MAMNCEAFKQNIDAYLDGELMLDEKMEMELHAAECEECARLLDEASRLMALCAELEDEVVVPLSAQAAWRRAVRAEAKKKRPSVAWIRGLGTIAAALMVAAISTLGINTGDSLPAVNPHAEYDLMTMQADTSADREARGGWSMAGTGGFVLTGNTLHSDGSVNDSVNGSMDDTRKDAEAQPLKEIASQEILSEAVKPIVLRSAKRSIQSDHYDQDVTWLEDLVSEYDAYFEERTETTSMEDGVSGRMIDAIVRVPSDRLDDFLTELDLLGSTVMRSESQEDVTARYMDTQSRLNALAAQKAKLDEMLASAVNVAELIAIDDKMTEVIASMEALEGDLRRWESQQSYSTVSVRLVEVFKKQIAPTATLGERMKNAFDEGVAWLGQFGQDVLVFAACAAPGLIIWIPVMALVIALICVLAKKRRK